MINLLLGALFPPDPRKLGTVPESSIRLHRIREGELRVWEGGEQGLATNVLEWTGPTPKSVGLKTAQVLENL